MLVIKKEIGLSEYKHECDYQNTVTIEKWENRNVIEVVEELINEWFGNQPVEDLELHDFIRENHEDINQTLEELRAW